jgi:hypothetical protein
MFRCRGSPSVPRNRFSVFLATAHASFSTFRKPVEFAIIRRMKRILLAAPSILFASLISIELTGCIFAPPPPPGLVFTDSYGYRHEGYYDDHHHWHGGYRDEHGFHHDDPGDWHDHR